MENLRGEETTAGRIYMARVELKMTQREFCEKSGLSLSTLKNYERGSSEPGAEALRQLKSIGVNPMWVLFGELPMVDAEVVASLPPIEDLLRKSAAELLACFEKSAVVFQKLNIEYPADLAADLARLSAPKS
jgi:transcriptional regulator with XRE-family HTH domain